MKRLFVNFKSHYWRLFTNVQNITIKYKHVYNLTQTNLQAKKVIKTHRYRHKVIKNAKLIKARIKLTLIIVLGLMK